MIVLPDRKLVIVTPPHTASRHLHQALCSPEHGGLEVVGLNPGGVVDHHFTEVCSEFDLYKRALIVRNPFSRATGLYRHYVWASENQPHTVKTHGLAWEEFAGCLASDDFAKLEWLYRYSITRLIEDTHYDFLVQFEHLEQQISDLLDDEIKLPPRYEDSPESIADYYVDEQIYSWIFTWGYTDLWRYYWDLIPEIRITRFMGEKDE